MVKKFIPTFLEFISTVGAEIPNVFIRNHPFYRAMSRAGLNRRKVYLGVYSLRRRGVVSQGGDKLNITKHGDVWIRKHQYLYFKMHNPIWDRKWRIIFFDIPNSKNKERQKFRYRMKRLHCFMLQKSVFAFPFACEDEVGEWCDDLGLDGCVEILISETIGSKELYAKKHFGL